MNVEMTGYDNIRFMCTDSEKQIAKLEWLYKYRRPEDHAARHELKRLLQAMKNMHAALTEMYEKATGKRFESNMDDYRTTLRKKLSN